MKRTVLLALGAALASAPATAAQPVYQWSGLYGGAQAGYAAANASEGRHSMPGVVYWDRGAEGATAGVFLGYNRLFAGSWLGGFEVEGNWSNLADGYHTDLIGQPYYVANWSAAARLRFGFLPEASTLIYGSIGIAEATFDYSRGFWSSAGDSGLVLSPVGVQLGAGIETFLSPHVSIRAEGVFTHYAGSTFPYGGIPYWDVAPDTLLARVGVAYHPGWLGQPQFVSAGEPVTYSWSGLYAGVHVGAAILHLLDDTVPPSTPDEYRDLSASSAVVGMHAGVNWQTGNLVAGVEGDASAVGLAPLFSGGLELARQSWTAAVRARLGVVTANNTLLYGTVGWAVGHFDYSRTFPPPATTGAVFNAGGLQVGAGAEAFLTRRVSVRVEGLYTAYGSHTIFDLGTPYWQAQSRSLEGSIGVSYHLR